MEVEIGFCECEHEGDLRNYREAITRAGALVLGSYLDPNAYETGWIRMETNDWAGFRSRFRSDPESGFCIGFQNVRGVPAPEPGLW